MDSWTDDQLAKMKQGGNNKCNEYLKKHGIGPRTPIKEKYESPAAQLYKEVLKARIEGRPEPTELPKVQPRTPPRHQSSGGSMGGMGGGGGAPDPNGMERLPGESDSQYVARQTRLREEAKARMAAKFGGSGGLGGVGSGGAGGRMQGIGSDPRYNPNGGFSGGGLDMGSLVSGFGSAMNSVTQSVSSALNEETVQNLKSTGGSFWGQLSSSVSQVASAVTQPDAGSDGLSELQNQFASKKPSNSMYSGFGSDTYSGGGGGGGSFARPPSSASSAGGSSPSSSGLQEAAGLPGEDRNGIERLTGESDEQYVMRQTRLREEARARMAAKFGGGGMGGVGSSSTPGIAPSRSYSPNSGSNHVVSAPSSGNSPFASNNRPGGMPASAPTSGNAPSSFPRPKTPPKKLSSDDFFSSFGN